MITILMSSIPKMIIRSLLGKVRVFDSCLASDCACFEVVLVRFFYCVKIFLSWFSAVVFGVRHFWNNHSVSSSHVFLGMR